MVFSIQVSNISCVNCATALTALLTNNIEDRSLKVSVNIMNEKVTLTALKQ
jgi:copper chaperone CopZ